MEIHSTGRVSVGSNHVRQAGRPMPYTSVQPRWRSRTNHQRFVSGRKTTWLRRLQQALQFPRYPIAPARLRLPVGRYAEHDPGYTFAIPDTDLDWLWKA